MLSLLRSRIAREARIVRALKPLLFSYRWIIALLIGLGTAASLAEGLGISMLIPLLYSLGLSGLDPPDDGGFLIRLLQQLFAGTDPANRLAAVCWGILGLVVLKNVLSFCTSLLYAWLDGQLAHRLRCQTFGQLLDVSMAFIDRQETGRLINIVEDETWDTSAALTTLIQIGIVVCNIAVFTILLLLISWQMTLLVLLVVMLISVIVQLMARRTETLSYRGLEAWATLSQTVVEALRGMRTIRLFNREALEKKRFVEVSNATRKIHLGYETVAATVAPLSEILLVCLLLGVLYTALQQPSNLPAILTFTLILTRLQPLVQALDSTRLKLIGTVAAVDAVNDLLTPTPERYIHSGPVAYRGFSDAISFRSVSFRYDSAGSSPPALDRVSIDLQKNQTTALVGPSGGGKSTLINLLVRFYDPSNGELFVDDLPLRQLEIDSWRRCIAVVHQDIHLFNTTVANNIAYGYPDADDNRIIEAARQAAAHEFISALPAGYQTQVGELGIRLSAGQRQRIALARAIVRDPDILILDEATNALDSISENIIQQALDALSRTRTVIVIAHRLSTIEQADQIIVMDHGRVRERGTLNELLQRQGLFTELYRLQTQKSQLI